MVLISMKFASHPNNNSCKQESSLSMEEVWKDINLSSLHHHHHHHQTTTAAAAHGIILQDFLASPFHKDPPKMDQPSSSALGGGAATSLSLNTGPPEFHKSNPQLDGLASSPAIFSSLCHKRALEVDELDSTHSSDRRFKRMIKNRDSAARSRARKQAYTSELEKEIADLMEENAKLRRQLEKSYFADPAQLPKKHKLYRTLTAPF